MRAVKRIRGTFKGFLAGLLLAAAWGAAVGIGVWLGTRLGGNESFGQKLRCGAEVGGIAGAAIFLFFQPPLGNLFHAILGKAPSWLFTPFYLVYFALAWPGVQIARLLGAVEWAAKPTDPKAAPAKAPDEEKACPFEGRIIAQAAIEFRDEAWMPNETVFEIHEDWRTSSNKMKFWGWVDPDGKVHEGAGDPLSKMDSPIVAIIKKGRDGVGCYVGDKLVGLHRVT